MLTTNISIPDRLINGQMGTVFRVIINQASNTPTIVYIKFDDPNAGKELVHNYPIPFARENNVVPIEPVSARIKIRPGKASSPEIQRVQFPITLAWACTHRNNRHRMRAPIFSQSKICLHKMAHSKGHFYSVQTPVARNFARLRGVRLFFSNTVFLKSLKNEIKLKNSFSKEDIFVKNSPKWVFQEKD